MTTQFLELHNRVFRLTVTPDFATTPGRCRRTATITVESGPELTQEECEQISKCIVADLVSQGIDLIGWSYGSDEGEGDDKDGD